MNRFVVGVILARGGSKGVARKNIRALKGKPLIQYIYEAAARSSKLDKIIVSTEDEEIAAIAESLGIEVPFLRPRELAADDTPGIDVIKNALAYFDETEYPVDAMVSLQPTNPFTRASTIDRTIDVWRETACDSVTTVSEVTKGHPYITKRFKENHQIENFCHIPKGLNIGRRQDRETAFYLTGALYLRSRQLITAKKADSHFLGYDSRAVAVDSVEAIDINTLLDFEFAEWMMGRRGDS